MLNTHQNKRVPAVIATHRPSFLFFAGANREHSIVSPLIFSYVLYEMFPFLGIDFKNIN